MSKPYLQTYIEPDNPVKVLYLVCRGRSGSTLLNLILGAHSRMVSVGELGSFNRMFSPEGEASHRCTCGTVLRDCEFWTTVREETKRRLHSKEIDLNPDDDDAFKANNHALLSVIASHSGREWVIDKSKKLDRLQRLLKHPDAFDVRIVHVVRDGRAVAHSFRNRGLRKDRQNEMKFNYFWNVFIWDYLNLKMLMQLSSRDNYIRLFYEDLVAAPKREIERVLDFVGLKFEAEALNFWEHTHHDFSGNRMRITGFKGIRPDKKYLSLSPLEWWGGTAIGLPMLLALGYPLSRPSAPADDALSAQAERKDGH